MQVGLHIFIVKDYLSRPNIFILFVHRFDVDIGSLNTSILDEVKTRNKNNVIYHEINAHINDHVFADKALEILDDWIEKGIIST